MAEIERLAAALPAGIAVGWTGLSYEERASGAQAMSLYAISLVVVFLCLAALYESCAIPASVPLVVPLAIATGAGAGGRTAIGTAIIGGVVAGTVLAVFFVPLVLRAGAAAVPHPAAGRGQTEPQVQPRLEQH